MQAKKPGEVDPAAKAALKKFEADNNVVEEEFYSYDETEYQKMLSERPWKSK